jgi:hypothetical protein
VGIHRHPVRAVRAGEGQVTCWLALVAPAGNSTTLLLPVNGAECLVPPALWVPFPGGSRGHDDLLAG